MAITFTVHSIPDPHGEKGKTLQHARAQSPGTRGTDGICPLICSRSSLSPADVKAALDSLGWALGESLSEGYHVKLEGVGYFSLSLRTIRADEGHMRIEVNGVNFHCDPKLLERLRKAPLKRDYAAEKRYRKIDTKDWTEDMLLLLRQTGYMSPRLFSALTGCSRRQAAVRLGKYVEAGLLIRQGRGRHTIYLPVPAGETAGEINRI
ncbi:HU family DNA-binding protein [Parabacteroides sp. Marseille-P3160]|uniref:HU family DNA-binding protein n=1 Tax=Parabacteroides sp. Marseille-P3160 TaxID=1917887 RepID=UPI001119A89D|nr:HU family DNA-binding protein [Parabacteroides sp. Marseille-P3160]